MTPTRRSTGCGVSSRREIKATEPRNPELAAWLKAELAALPPQALVFAAASDFLPDDSHMPPGKPRPVHMLRRGDIHQPGKAAVPGTLGCVDGLPARFSIAPGRRRIGPPRGPGALDHRPGNPLTWRSIVNRVWHWHFGRGLVSTPNDFGRMGGLPSHPELLDWLATTVPRVGRLAQAAAPPDRHQRGLPAERARTTPSFAAIDADNQWLWRQNRRRLDAESDPRRDPRASPASSTARWAARRSSSSRCGPACTSRRWSTTRQYDWDSPGSCRRSVYRFLFRTLPDPFFDALDAADASQLTAVRNESTTPLQALELLNNPFVLRQCEQFARRLETSHRAGASTSRSRLAIELAYGRPPAADEVAVALGLRRAGTGWRTCAG